jgi:hypothetical protein
MRRDSKLSYQEMDAILKRSVELQARRGSTEFSEQDVLDAAKELGVDAQTAAEVVQAHLARRATAADLAPRPFDTRIQLEVSPDSFSLTVPPLRLDLRFLGALGVTGAWFAFISYFTSRFMGREAGLIMVLIWLSGLGTLGGMVLMLIRKTRLTLNRDSGELTGILRRRRVLFTSQLRVRIDDPPAREDDDRADSRPKVLLLEHGVETIRLLDGYSEQERRWIESELSAWLQNV